MEDIGIKVLEEKHMISILLYLHENGGCNKMDIYHNISTNPRIPEKLDMLEELNLITQFQTEKRQPTTIALTTNGEKIANYLSEISKVISSNVKQ